MDLLIFLGVNAVLLVVLLVAIALLRAPASTRQQRKSAEGPTDVGRERKQRVAGDRPSSESVEASVSHVVDQPSNGTDRLEASVTTRSGSAGAPFEVLTFDAGDNAASNGSVANGAMTNRSPNGAASDGSACNGASPDRFASGHVAKNGSELAAAVNGAHQPAPNVAEGSSVFAVDRPAAAQPASSICLDAHLEGDRPARDALVGRVIDQLTPLGFIAERLTPSRSRLRSADGRMVAITARPITLDEDRIEIVLDTALAGPAFTALRQWHRVELGGTDQVRLSARIR